MGLKFLYEISCNCGSTFQTELWEYVFADRDPDLRTSILFGNFNLVSCSSCGADLDADISYLYRDEKNKLWIWVCGAKERKAGPTEKSERISGYFLDDQRNYQKHIAQGRNGLLYILLKEDPELKEKEINALKTNPVIRILVDNQENCGYLFLTGNKIKNLALPLSSQLLRGRLSGSKAEENGLVDLLGEAVNLHNRFSSLLSQNSIHKWQDLFQNEIGTVTGDEYETFAQMWVDFKIDNEKIRFNFPGTYRFFQRIEQMPSIREIVIHEFSSFSRNSKHRALG